MQNKLTFLAAFWLLMAPAAASAENILLESGGGHYSVKTKTFNDYRFREVIRQQRDFSCGSATLASMLTYHYNYPVSESEVLESMYDVGDKKKIEKEGFSLLDMKRYLASIGLRGEGYKVSLEHLDKVGIPAIALINYNGYLHFVLIRGLSDQKVLVADPAMGMKTFSRDKFKSMWNGILFVITNDKQIGKAHFDLAKHWGRTVGDHALNEAPLQGLGGFTLHTLASPGYF